MGQRSDSGKCCRPRGGSDPDRLWCRSGAGAGPLPRSHSKLAPGRAHRHRGNGCAPDVGRRAMDQRAGDQRQRWHASPLITGRAGRRPTPGEYLGHERGRHIGFREDGGHDTPRGAAAHEADRVRFTELFGDDAFMVFSSQPLSEEAAKRRFDHMLAMGEIIPFSKRPIVERASGQSSATPASTPSPSRARNVLNGGTGWYLRREELGTPPRRAKLCSPAPARRSQVNCLRSSTQPTIPPNVCAASSGSPSGSRRGSMGTFGISTPWSSTTPRRRRRSKPGFATASSTGTRCGGRPSPSS